MRSRVLAIAGVTWTEAVRGRLWLVPVLAAAGLLLAGPRLQSVDDTGALKLAVVSVQVVIGFVVTLFAVLVGASQLRRDLDGRLGLTLFSKPLGPGRYLLGRWTGVLAIMGGATLIIALAGAVLLAWRFGGLPEVRATATAVRWDAVTAVGETLPDRDRRSSGMLSGAPGDGIRWHFSGLPTGRDLEVLVKVAVQGPDPLDPVRSCLAEITASPTAAGTPIVLALQPGSPYGGATRHRPAVPGKVLMAHRDAFHRDLTNDYCRLLLPAAAIGADGRAVLGLTRLESTTSMLVTHDAMQIGVDGGGFLANLLRGALVTLASAGLLTAWTLLLASLANLGVTLLGGLTLFFAGSALWTIQDTLDYERPSQVLTRLLVLCRDAMPNFDRFSISAELAAGHAVPWSVVGQAWLYYGTYSVIFLSLAWFALRRREL